MYEKIRQDIRFAMKDHDKFKMNLLKCVWSDIQKFQKDNNGVISGAEVVNIVKKYIKSIDDNLEKLKGKIQHQDSYVINLNAEKEILKKYLPEQLTKTEMITMINTCKINKMNFGQIMRWFKENHPNKYNGKTLSELVKEIL